MYTNSQPVAPSTLDPYTFLHRIYAFGVKIGPVLERFMIVIS